MLRRPLFVAALLACTCGLPFVAHAQNAAPLANPPLPATTNMDDIQVLLKNERFPGEAEQRLKKMTQNVGSMITLLRAADTASMDTANRQMQDILADTASQVRTLHFIGKQNGSLRADLLEGLRNLQNGILALQRKLHQQVIEDATIWKGERFRDIVLLNSAANRLSKEFTLYRMAFNAGYRPDPNQQVAAPLPQQAPLEAEQPAQPPVEAAPQPVQQSAAPQPQLAQPTPRPEHLATPAPAQKPAAPALAHPHVQPETVFDRALENAFDSVPGKRNTPDIFTMSPVRIQPEEPTLAQPAAKPAPTPLPKKLTAESPEAVIEQAMEEIIREETPQPQVVPPAPQPQLAAPAQQPAPQPQQPAAVPPAETLPELPKPQLAAPAATPQPQRRLQGLILPPGVRSGETAADIAAEETTEQVQQQAAPPAPAAVQADDNIEKHEIIWQAESLPAVASAPLKAEDMLLTKPGDIIRVPDIAWNETGAPDWDAWAEEMNAIEPAAGLSGANGARPSRAASKTEATQKHILTLPEELVPFMRELAEELPEFDIQVPSDNSGEIVIQQMPPARTPQPEIKVGSGL